MLSARRLPAGERARRHRLRLERFRRERGRHFRQHDLRQIGIQRSILHSSVPQDTERPLRLVRLLLHDYDQRLRLCRLSCLRRRQQQNRRQRQKPCLCDHRHIKHHPFGQVYAAAEDSILIDIIANLDTNSVGTYNV